VRISEALRFNRLRPDREARAEARATRPDGRDPPQSSSRRWRASARVARASPGWFTWRSARECPGQAEACPTRADARDLPRAKRNPDRKAMRVSAC